MAYAMLLLFPYRKDGLQIDGNLKKLLFAELNDQTERFFWGERATDTALWLKTFFPQDKEVDERLSTIKEPMEEFITSKQRSNFSISESASLRILYADVDVLKAPRQFELGWIKWLKDWFTKLDQKVETDTIEGFIHNVASLRITYPWLWTRDDYINGNIISISFDNIEDCRRKVGKSSEIFSSPELELAEFAANLKIATAPNVYVDENGLQVITTLFNEGNYALPETRRF